MTTIKYPLFNELFPTQLEDWIKEQKAKGKHGSQKTFAEEVIKLWKNDNPGLICPVNPSYVTDWKTGRQGIPYSYMKYICEVLDVSEDVYYSKTKEDKYRLITDYITDIGKKNVAFAKDEGLDLDLVSVLSKLINFDELFPLYSPINHKTVDPETLCVKYDREVHFMDSAPIDKSLQYLQIKRNGETYTMHKSDLAYLKEVQDQLITFVEYLFHKRYKEMQEEVQTFNQDLIEVKVDGDPVAGSKKDYYIKQSIGNAVTFDTPADLLEALDHITDPKGKSISISHKPVTWDFICEHDRFAKYSYVQEKEGK